MKTPSMIQRELAEKVVLNDSFTHPIQTIGGLDVSNTPFDPAQMIFGAAVTVRYPSLELEESTSCFEKQEFPYIPGLLAFREVPVLIRSCRQLSKLPNVFMVDGHGISHPKRLGVASHLGVLLDHPTIGVAKSILVGAPAAPLAEDVGSTAPLIWKEEMIGMLVRTKKRALPLIISTGHKISLETAVRLVLSCMKGYRLPEPTRLAHLAANDCRRQKSKNSTLPV